MSHVQGHSLRFGVVLTASLLAQNFCAAWAQPPAPPYPPPAGAIPASLIFIDAPQPREIKLHDIITIIVNEKSQVTVNSIFNRQRNASLKAELKEFIRLDDDLRLTNAAADNQPAIDSNLTGRIQSQGQLNDSEGINYRIAATVVDILPNGNLILEARKSIRTNRDMWEYQLTGTLRSEDINRDNTAFSEHIANLNIEKRQRGKVYDSTRLPWGTRLFEIIFPF
jgi:flagellar L-ring protein precursor FlgH